MKNVKKAHFYYARKINPKRIMGSNSIGFLKYAQYNVEFCDGAQRDLRVHNHVFDI